MNGWRKFRSSLLVFGMLVLLLCGTAQAKPADSWNAAWDGIDAVYDGLTMVQSLVKQESAEITALRKRNNEQLSAINAKVKAIDRPLLDRLAAEGESLQRKHAALLENYSSLGKQVTAAKKRKDNKAADLLELKRNQLKPAATAAAAEIKAKKDALAAAKKATAGKAKIVKDALIPVQTLKKQITAENKTIAAVRKVLSAADKRYKSSVKQGDAVGALLELKTVSDQTNQVHASLKKVYEWEKKIAQTLASAATKLPK
ncbi:hypothetical protein [Paenibacillus macerans]|uniref:hypothetical protein n=1 Tax=Paenibacillus macerans TaxID=44252 RepID=UPI003D3166A3